MFGLAQFGGGAVDLGARVDQLVRVQQVAALVALVAAGIGVAADIAGAFHVAVGQEAFLAGGVPLHFAVSDTGNHFACRARKIFCETSKWLCVCVLVNRS